MTQTEQSLSNKLFSGWGLPMGGLSNERELVRLCPKEFLEDNPWSELASNIFFGGASTESWEFKEPDKSAKQLACFKALLSSWDIPHEDKEAVAGWMLSAMLVKIPD